MLHRIVDVQVRPDYRVWIRFEDGTDGEVDLSELVGKRAGFETAPTRRAAAIIRR